MVWPIVSVQTVVNRTVSLSDSLVTLPDSMLTFCAMSGPNLAWTVVASIGDRFHLQIVAFIFAVQASWVAALAEHEARGIYARSDASALNGHNVARDPTDTRNIVQVLG